MLVMGVGQEKKRVGNLYERRIKILLKMTYSARIHVMSSGNSVKINHFDRKGNCEATEIDKTCTRSKKN